MATNDNNSINLLPSNVLVQDPTGGIQDTGYNTNQNEQFLVFINKAPRAVFKIDAHAASSLSL